MSLTQLTSFVWRRQLRATTRFVSSLIQFDSPQDSLLEQSQSRSQFQFHCIRGKKSYKKKLIDCITTEIQHEKDNYETDPIVKEGPPNGFNLLDMKESNIVLHKQYQNEDITIEASSVEQPLPEKENPEDPDSPTTKLSRITYSNRTRPLFIHPRLGIKKPKNYVIVRDPVKTGMKYVFPKQLVIGPEGKYHHTFGWDMETEPPKDPFFDPPVLEVSHIILFSVTILKTGFDEKLILQCETDGGYMSLIHVGLELVSTPKTVSPQYSGPAFNELDETLQDTFNNWMEERGIDDVLGDYLVQKLHDIEQKHYMKWLESTQRFISHE
eukprot:g2629.t1